MGVIILLSLLLAKKKYSKSHQMLKGVCFCISVCFLFKYAVYYCAMLVQCYCCVIYCVDSFRPAN